MYLRDDRLRLTMTDVAMTLQCTLQSLDKVATELEQHGLAPQEHGSSGFHG